MYVKFVRVRKFSRRYRQLIGKLKFNFWGWSFHHLCMSWLKLCNNKMCPHHVRFLVIYISSHTFPHYRFLITNSSSQISLHKFLQHTFFITYIWSPHIRSSNVFPYSILLRQITSSSGAQLRESAFEIVILFSEMYLEFMFIKFYAIYLLFADKPQGSRPIADVGRHWFCMIADKFRFMANIKL